MRTELIISGFGGQGVLVAGTILCQAAMREEKNVTFFPSYGAEMRGGTARCHILISDEPIGAPIVYTPDILVAFSVQAYQKYSPQVGRDGTLFVNASLFTPDEREARRCVQVPANRLAEKCGSLLVANSIMLGALITVHPVVKTESILGAIPAVLTEKKKQFWEINTRAFHEGAAFVSRELPKMKATG